MINNASQNNYVSNDGINWTVSTLPTTHPWTDAAYNGSIWMVCASDGNIAISTDNMATWTINATLAGQGLFWINAFSNGVWAVRNNINNSVLYTSSDNGTTWTFRNTGLARLGSIIFVNNTYYAFGASGNDQQVRRSTNLTSWSSSTIRSGISSGASVGIYAYGKFWATHESNNPQNNTTMISNDSFTWSFDSNYGITSPNNMYYGKGVIFIGHNGTLTQGLVATGAITEYPPELPIDNALNGDWRFTGNINANVGNLTSLSVVGNIGNADVVTANLFTGTLTTADQPNITSVGNISNLITTGNITLAANIAQEGGDPVAATDTTIAFKIPIVINGNTYYISLTAAQ